MNAELRAKMASTEFAAKVIDCLEELTAGAAELLEKKGVNVYWQLTTDERAKFSGGGEQPMRLAKSLMCAVADEVEGQFSAESTLRDIKAIKRIRKQRYC